jgi:hypothetical protein
VGDGPRQTPRWRNAHPTPPHPTPPHPPQFSLRFPFRSAEQVAAGRAVGSEYLITFLDNEVFVGRASAPAGSFIFVRESWEEPELPPRRGAA